MKSIPDEVWRQIEQSRPVGDEMLGRQALPEITPRLLAAIDAAGHRLILLALDPDDAGVRDMNSRGLSVETQSLVLAGQEPRRYVTLRCHDASGHVVLSLIGGEMAERLRSGSDDPAGIVSRVLARWRRFWAQQPRRILTWEEQTGLFSELWFMAYWLIPSAGTPMALNSWRGPHGARHDFEQVGLSIEVKATSSARGRLFRVNGIRQMEPPENGRLLLFGMRLREEGGATNTLPMLVRICRDLTAGCADAENMLDVGLAASGYADAYEEEYEVVRWRVFEEILFEVRDDFPRIIRATFPTGVPAGIEDVGYTINLDAFDHLIAAREPVGASALLGG